MTAFQNATELAVLAWLRDPNWVAQDGDKTGAPTQIDAGVDLSDSPVVKYDLRLRESLRFRTGRVTIPDSVTVADGQDYSIEVRGQTASISTTGSSDVASVLKSLRDEVNKLKLDVRATTEDTDSDNTAERLRLESNHTPLVVTNAVNDQTYFVEIDGERAEYTSASSGATIDSITSNLASNVNGSISIASAHTVDFDGDDKAEMFFVRPVSHESIDVSIGPSTDTNKPRSAFEDASPSISVSSSSTDLDLDLDAAELDYVRFYGLLKGDNEASPGGWRLIDEQTNIGYRGLHEIQQVGGYRRGYIEVVNTSDGTVRSVEIGTPTLEG